MLAGTAQAADVPGPPPYVPVTPVAPVSWLSSGWYLRGDLAYHFGTMGNAESAPPFANPSDNRIGNAVAAGIGAGIKTSWARTDFTLDYISAMKYTGSVAAPDDTSAKIQATTLLFNGYFDLGTWYRLTPYVGGGIGTAYARVTDYQSTGAPPFTGNVNHNQWTLAWAGMAGVGWQVAPNLLLDIGYRYINIGDVKTGSDAFGAMTFRNVAGHEVRVGLRWSFDDLRLYP
jgi:opacity protein-like surface antigen